MRHDTGAELGIGELARAAGVPVRTVRFYCDEGVLTPVRSGGGHRRFGEETVGRLVLVRRLRALGLGLAAIVGVLDGERSLGEAVTEERAALDVELEALSWRRASLRAVEAAAPEERAARLELLSAASDGRTARAALEAMWAGRFGLRTPAESVAMFLSVSVPEAPADPTPRQVLAYAGMLTAVRGQSFAPLTDPDQTAYRDAVLDGAVGDVCAQARPLVLDGTAPGPGRVLDDFVAAHASTRGVPDTPAFRRSLLRVAAVDRRPSIRRYWRLVGDVTGEDVTVGEAYTWLLDSLDSALSGAA